MYFSLHRVGRHSIWLSLFVMLRLTVRSACSVHSKLPRNAVVLSPDYVFRTAVECLHISDAHAQQLIGPGEMRLRNFLES